MMKIAPASDRPTIEEEDNSTRIAKPRTRAPREKERKKDEKQGEHMGEQLSPKRHTRK